VTDDEIIAYGAGLLRDRALVRFEPTKEKSASGLIIIPTTAKSDFRYDIAHVIAVGPGRYLEDGTRLPLEAKVGDRVVCMDRRFHEEAGDTGTLAIVQEGAIMAVMED